MFQLHELSKRPSAKPRTITRHLIQPHGWPTRPPLKLRTSKWHIFRLHELPKRPSVKPRKSKKPNLAEPKCGLDTNAWTTLQKYGREICPQDLFIFLIIFTAHPNNLQLLIFLCIFKTRRARLQLFLRLFLSSQGNARAYNYFFASNRGFARKSLMGGAPEYPVSSHSAAAPARGRTARIIAARRRRIAAWISWRHRDSRAFASACCSLLLAAC